MSYELRALLVQLGVSMALYPTRIHRAYSLEIEATHPGIRTYFLVTVAYITEHSVRCRQRSSHLAIYHPTTSS